MDNKELYCFVDDIYSTLIHYLDFKTLKNFKIFCKEKKNLNRIILYNYDLVNLYYYSPYKRFPKNTVKLIIHFSDIRWNNLRLKFFEDLKTDLFEKIKLLIIFIPRGNSNTFDEQLKIFEFDLSSFKSLELLHCVNTEKKIDFIKIPNNEFLTIRKIIS